MPDVNHPTRLVLGGLALVAALVFVPAASASTVELNQNDLSIDGDADSDLITVSTDGTTLTVVDTGTGGATSGGAPCVQAGATTVTCPVNPPAGPTVNRFEVELDNGVDSFTNQNFVTDNGHVHSSGPSGASTGAKTINGGPGSQSIDGGADSDNLNGGDGDDFLFDGGDGLGSPSPTGGNDLIDGGPGQDTAGYFRDGTTPLSLSLDAIANDGQAGETDNLVSIEDLSGGEGDDTITGNEFANTLVGAQGHDTVIGLGGADQLFGDFAFGGATALRGIVGAGGADDTVIGGAGRDGLDCGGGVADVGIRDRSDQVASNCERIGADVTGDSSGLSGKKKNKFKVGLTCPESEGATCAGKLSVTSNGKQIAKGKFSVAAGQTKNAKAKLSKKGAKAVKKAGGSLLVSAAALTDEPGGVSESAASVLIFK